MFNFTGQRSVRTNWVGNLSRKPFYSGGGLTQLIRHSQHSLAFRGLVQTRTLTVTPTPCPSLTLNRNLTWLNCHNPVENPRAMSIHSVSFIGRLSTRDFFHMSCDDAVVSWYLYISNTNHEMHKNQQNSYNCSYISSFPKKIGVYIQIEGTKAKSRSFPA